MQAVLLAELSAHPRPPIDASQPLHLLGQALNLLLTAAAVSSGVSWHRLLLLKEQPSASSGLNIATGYFWRYVGTGLLIGLIAAVPLANRARADGTVEPGCLRPAEHHRPRS